MYYFLRLNRGQHGRSNQFRIPPAKKFIGLPRQPWPRGTTKRPSRGMKKTGNSTLGRRVRRESPRARGAMGESLAKRGKREWGMLSPRHSGPSLPFPHPSKKVRRTLARVHPLEVERAHAGEGQGCRQTNGLPAAPLPVLFTPVDENGLVRGGRPPRGETAWARPCGRWKGGQQAIYCTHETNGRIFFPVNPLSSQTSRLRHWRGRRPLSFYPKGRRKRRKRSQKGTVPAAASRNPAYSRHTTSQTTLTLKQLPFKNLPAVFSSPARELYLL